MMSANRQTGQTILIFPAERNVASGILPDVEGVHLAARKKTDELF
jgi:hypothetical protein